ncbi:MAG: NifB/NifX family molybdenum-iron cluster-binding protein [Spirochaetes bacterium]|nr:NifB/NifX family molybdenum-iron cluster-binding protein [Spirochaetota bacterium]
MKLCVTSTGPSLESMMDPRFGRCIYFIIVEPDSMQFEAVENDASGAAGGAGVQSAKAVADSGAGVVITGNVGPKAYQALSAAGIAIVTGAEGVSVKEAVQNYLSGKYRPVAGATVQAHSGLGG